MNIPDPKFEIGQHVYRMVGLTISRYEVTKLIFYQGGHAGHWDYECIPSLGFSRMPHAYGEHELSGDKKEMLRRIIRNITSIEQELDIKLLRDDPEVPDD